MNQDFSRRITLVIDKSLPAWQAMNATAHLSAHFGHYLKENYSTGHFFETKDNVNIPRNTQYPIIIFRAEKDDLTQFAKEVNNLSDIEKMYFVKEMIETTNDEEIAGSLLEKDFNDLCFLGIGLFGDNTTLKNLTKKFKLWS